ncbi:Putative pectate lyase 2 [Glycine soja]|nr:Putative pectate lyase 2 [Glycine soja]
MKSLQIVLFLVTMLMALVIADSEKKESPFLTYVKNHNYTQNHATPSSESEVLASLRGSKGLRGHKNVRGGGAMTCDKYPRVCRAKGSEGPDCCKRKCVNVSNDRNNCGMCGKRCKYSQVCCKAYPSPIVCTTFSTSPLFVPALASTPNRDSTKEFNALSPISSYINKTPEDVVIMNTIDSCWRAKTNWASNRKALADCAIGFGKEAIGGKFGDIYEVTDPSDDPVDPKPGTLRYGAIQTEPLWITFAKDMDIRLKNELMVNSYKTIDGRGAKVEIANGACITIQGVSHVIVHGISIHDCEPGKGGMVRSSPEHVGYREGSDGDAISIFASSNVWIDHCFLARCTDGLIDVIHASTAVTISNNYFTQHDKVMLLGHSDEYTADKVMRVTVAFNRFASGLIERMPRVRFGYAHVVNNLYDEWLMYAIGGSADPTIFSEGNYFTASNDSAAKQVTKRESSEKWNNWKWRSFRDEFINGAYFVPSGYGSCTPIYSAAQSFIAAQASMVPLLTLNAGPLNCVVDKAC